jgi:signal transduction histidine kinase
MKTLRALILVDTLLLATLGLWMLFHPHSLPAVYAEGKPYQEMATLRLLGTALGGLALVLFVLSADSLVGDRRRLALWLSGANGLVAMMAFIQQTAIWGSTVGWLLVMVFLGMSAALAWAGWRPLKPEEIAAEVATLQIPPETREVLLRQIGETAAQEERNRLARDLHDSIKQQLFTINVSTAAAQELWEQNPERAKTALADVRRSAREAMVEMQALLHQLQPRALASAGLVEALREQCEALGYRTGAEVSVELGEAIPDERLPPGAQETLFRIAQEALANVARHSRARNVRAWLGREGDQAVLRVEDDGQGFDPESATSGMGLRNLRERAESLRGMLEVRSASGAGTRICVRIPFTSPPILQPVSPVETELKRLKFILFWLGYWAALFWLDRPIVNRTKSYGDLISDLMPFLLLMLFTWVSTTWAKKRLRSDLTAHPDTAPAKISLRVYWSRLNHVLWMLLATWYAPWYWRFDQPGWRAWTIVWIAASLVCGSLAVAELVKLHRVTEIRRRWLPGLWSSLADWKRTGLLIAFLILAGLSGALGVWLISRLELVERLLLLFGVLIVGYILTRQPRTEAAPA